MSYKAWLKKVGSIYHKRFDTSLGIERMFFCDVVRPLPHHVVI
jgi:hypothetical protein